MDDEQQESLKQWVAQVTSAMQSIETFGHTAIGTCLLYTSPSPRDLSTSRMPSSA